MGLSFSTLLIPPNLQSVDCSWTYPAESWGRWSLCWCHHPGKCRTALPQASQSVDMALMSPLVGSFPLPTCPVRTGPVDGSWKSLNLRKMKKKCEEKGEKGKYRDVKDPWHILADVNILIFICRKSSAVISVSLYVPASLTLVAWKGRQRKSWCSSSRLFPLVSTEKP